MLITRLAPAFALVLALGACDTGGTKQTIGTIGGAGAGALLGSQFGSGSGKLAMVGLGTLAGALVGGSVGKSLDSADRMAAQGAETRAYAAPIGDTITWNNPQSGNRGTITPTRDGYSSVGAYCREFQQTITVGGEQKRGYGTACRQPDGSWKIVGE
ncbi:MAG: RT0821/Lpp0805 family surface protein [Rhodospirillaceae bacterium]